MTPKPPSHLYTRSACCPVIVPMADDPFYGLVYLKLAHMDTRHQHFYEIFETPSDFIGLSEKTSRLLEVSITTCYIHLNLATQRYKRTRPYTDSGPSSSDLRTDSSRALRRIKSEFTVVGPRVPSCEKSPWHGHGAGCVQSTSCINESSIKPGSQLCIVSNCWCKNILDTCVCGPPRPPRTTRPTEFFDHRTEVREKASVITIWRRDPGRLDT